MRDVLAVIMFPFCDWLEINRLVCENNVTIISNSIVYLLCFERDIAFLTCQLINLGEFLQHVS